MSGIVRRMPTSGGVVRSATRAARAAPGRRRGRRGRRRGPPGSPAGHAGRGAGGRTRRTAGLRRAGGGAPARSRRGGVRRTSWVCTPRRRRPPWSPTRPRGRPGRRRWYDGRPVLGSHRVPVTVQAAGVSASGNPDAPDGGPLSLTASELSERPTLHIGLISDTHIPEARPELWPQVFDVFDGVDGILHGGDIHDLVVLDQLDELAPLWSARGNGEDGSAGRPIAADDDRLRYSWLLDLAGAARRADPRPADAGDPAELHRRALEGPPLRHPDIDVLVYGDSHVERIDLMGPTLCVNPGSPTYPHNLQHAARHARLPRHRRPHRPGDAVAAHRRRHGAGAVRRAHHDVPDRNDRRGRPMTEFQNVIVETDGPVATITLNRPEQLNAMSTGLLDDLYGALRELNPGDDVRVIRLRGAGRAFCPGYDLSPSRSYGGRAGTATGEGRRDGRHGRVVDRPRPRVAAPDDRALAVDVELPQADHRPDPRLLPVRRPRPDRRVRHRVRRRGHAVRAPGGARHGHPGDDRHDADAHRGDGDEGAAVHRRPLRRRGGQGARPRAPGAAGRRARCVHARVLPTCGDEPARHPVGAQAHHEPDARADGHPHGGDGGRRVRLDRPPRPVVQGVRPAHDGRGPARGAGLARRARTAPARCPTTTPPSGATARHDDGAGHGPAAPRLRHPRRRHPRRQGRPGQAARSTAALAERVDAVLLVGDIFDHNRMPTEVGQALVDELARLDVPVVVLPGNHDCLVPDADLEPRRRCRRTST